QYIRHATLILEIGGRKILVDPMLSDVSSMPPVPLTPNREKNPLIPLPPGSLDCIRAIDAVLLTHFHFDHFDKIAGNILSEGVLIFCQPGDEKKLKKMGFTNAKAIAGNFKWGQITFKRFPVNHARGFLLKIILGKSSSFFLQSGSEELFITGDAVLDSLLIKSLEEIKPSRILANAGSAKFLWGEPVTLTAGDIKDILHIIPDAMIAAVHMGAVNHCLLTKEMLKNFASDENIEKNLIIPGEGEIFNF
ncbi:MAG: MBL fold metallo-hydrolase, partial [Brevinematales bacterium]